jgi:hypothetical protein
MSQILPITTACSVGADSLVNLVRPHARLPRLDALNSRLDLGLIARDADIDVAVLRRFGNTPRALTLKSPAACELVAAPSACLLRSLALVLRNVNPRYSELLTLLDRPIRDEVECGSAPAE